MIPEIKFKRVVVDPHQVSSGVLFMALDDSPNTNERTAQALARGALAAIVAQKVELDVDCLWLDLRDLRPSGIRHFRSVRQPGEPVCLLVADSLEALRNLAAYWRAKQATRLVGIAGSIGKTIAGEMVHSVLSQRFRTLKGQRKGEGDYRHEVSVLLTLLRLPSDYERAVVEIHGPEIGRLAAIVRPHIGLVTNVHSRFDAPEDLAKLVEVLPEEGMAVLNGDDPQIRGMADRTKARTLRYGLSPHCDLQASHIESRGLEGVRFQLHYRSDTIHVKIPLLGRYSVHTALAAAAVGLAEGESWEEIVAGLRGMSEQLRLVITPGAKNSTILDDTYEANPTSTIAALNLLAELTPARRVAVLGDMLELGKDEEEGHRKVGRRAVDVVAKLITVGSRGRLIGQEALSCGMSEDDIFLVDSIEEAIARLNDILGPGDMVLVKGSPEIGMEEIILAMADGDDI